MAIALYYNVVRLSGLRPAALPIGKMRPRTYQPTFTPSKHRVEKGFLAGNYSSLELRRPLPARRQRLISTTNSRHPSPSAGRDQSVTLVRVATLDGTGFPRRGQLLLWPSLVRLFPGPLGSTSILARAHDGPPIFCG